MGVEPALVRFSVNRLNQLDHRGNWAQGLPTLTIIRYLAPFFSRTRPKSVTVSRSSRAQYVFLISQPRVSGPMTEHESFFLGRWSRVCGWRICEKQKKPPLSGHFHMCVQFSFRKTARTCENERQVSHRPWRTWVKVTRSHSMLKFGHKCTPQKSEMFWFGPTLQSVLFIHIGQKI